MTSQIDHLTKTSPVLRVSTHMYGVSKEIHGKMFIHLLFLYIEMKELCKPSVKKKSLQIFQTMFPQMDPPVSFRRWYVGWPMLDPHSQCLQMISWLTYVRPPSHWKNNHCQEIISLLTYVGLHPQTHTHKEKQHNKYYCTCSYDVSRIAATYMLEITYTDMFFLLLALYSWWIFLYIWKIDINTIHINKVYYTNHINVVFKEH